MFIIDADGTIRLTRGDTARLAVEVTNEQTGEPYEIKRDDTVTLTVRRSESTTDILMQKVLIGSGSFHIDPDDTKTINYGKYKYDIQINTASGDVYTVIPPSIFEIMGEVTW